MDNVNPKSSDDCYIAKAATFSLPPNAIYKVLGATLAFSTKDHRLFSISGNRFRKNNSRNPLRQFAYSGPIDARYNHPYSL
jgi:hypothetical protein